MKRLCGLLGLAFVSTAVPAAPAYHDLKVGAVTLRVPLPKGYCVPIGVDAVDFKELAVPDKRNVTLLSLVDCDRDSLRNRYLLVKAPKADVNVTVTPSEFRAIATTITDEDIASASKALTNEVAADKTEASGVATELNGRLVMRGHDDRCIYMSGAMTTVKANKTQRQVVGACMTLVGSRLITLYAYEDTEEALAYKSMLPMLTQWASEIRPANTTGKPKRRRAR